MVWDDGYSSPQAVQRKKNRIHHSKNRRTAQRQTAILGQTWRENRLFGVMRGAKVGQLSALCRRGARHRHRPNHRRTFGSFATHHRQLIRVLCRSGAVRSLSGATCDGGLLHHPGARHSEHNISLYKFTNGGRIHRPPPGYDRPALQTLPESPRTLAHT